SNPERIAGVLARFMRGMAAIGAPIELFLSASSDLILKLLPFRAEPTAITDEEIGFLLREGVAAGHIPKGETAIVAMAFRPADRRVRAGMAPRGQTALPDLQDSGGEIRPQSPRSS